MNQEGKKYFGVSTPALRPDEMDTDRRTRPEANPPASALDTQIGGDHYQGMVIQPIEFIHANNIPFCEASAIKYLCRWRSKNGVQDLNKAKHFIDMLIELESPK